MKHLLKVGITIAACAFTSVTLADVPGEPQWDYVDQHLWGAIDDPYTSNPPFQYPYATCSLGRSQSPVDLAEYKAISATNMNRPSPVYRVGPLIIQNDGHTIVVKAPDGVINGMKIGNEPYQLLQFHMHAPSEHVIDGVHYPLEIHFVHATDDGKLAVLGVFVEEGEHNAEFQKILDQAPTSPSGDINTGASINPALLLPGNSALFATWIYAGSLTTPPCTEGVHWYVIKKSITASLEQIQQFEALYDNNARFAQDLNGRQVLFSSRNSIFPFFNLGFRFR